MKKIQKYPARAFSPRFLGVWLLLIVSLVACGDIAETPTPEATQPQLSVAEPFRQTEDGTYTTTVTEDRVTIQGTQSGIERLRFKLNETVWLDATLNTDEYSFELSGLNEGTNTVSLRLDGKDGSVVVVVIVIIFDPEGDGMSEVTPDSNSRDMVALTANNTLVFFNSGSPEDTDSLGVTGVDGTLLGMDFRPANGKLYALSSSNILYTLDIGSGAATQVSVLSSDFTGRARSGIDFNPVADRLRITGSNGQNFRVNVDTGAVTEDGTLAYVAGDTNEKLTPSITASAYTSSIAGATTTFLYDIDANLNILTLQNPPNDGGLQTLGTLGVDFEAVGGFDIFTDALGTNTAYTLSGEKLYMLELEKGSATLRGNVKGGPFQGLAVIPSTMTAPKDPNPKDMIGLTDNNTLVFFNSGTPGTSTSLAVTNVQGKLLGIDFRPANGYLYALSDANKLYTIDVATGSATEKILLSKMFEAGAMSGFDFNPVADRLRLTGTNGQNFRVNVDTGEVILDGKLSYIDGDVNDGNYQGITASGYTNSRTGASATILYNIDAAQDVLVLQDPPNDGGLKTVGSLGIDFAEVGGFDILADMQNMNTAYALSNGQVYGVDLMTGKATSYGNVSGSMFRGLAIISR